MEQPKSTADYRKYPKGPNFGLIVTLFCISILVIAAVAYFVIRKDNKLIPGAYNPHPTSQVQPLSSPNPVA